MEQAFRIRKCEVAHGLSFIVMMVRTKLRVLSIRLALTPFFDDLSSFFDWGAHSILDHLGVSLFLGGSRLTVCRRKLLLASGIHLEFPEPNQDSSVSAPLV